MIFLLRGRIITKTSQTHAGWRSNAHEGRRQPSNLRSRAGGSSYRITGQTFSTLNPMNDRLFCQHIALVVERKRQEAQAQAQAEVGRGEEAAGISEKREEGQETARSALTPVSLSGSVPA